MKLDKVTVKGRQKSRFSSPSNSSGREETKDGFDVDISEDGDQAMPDFTVEPIIIKEATVKLRKGEQTIEDDNSSAYDSTHDY